MHARTVKNFLQGIIQNVQITIQLRVVEHLIPRVAIRVSGLVSIASSSCHAFRIASITLPNILVVGDDNTHLLPRAKASTVWVTCNIISAKPICMKWTSCKRENRAMNPRIPNPYSGTRSAMADNTS